MSSFSVLRALAASFILQAIPSASFHEQVYWVRIPSSVLRYAHLTLVAGMAVMFSQAPLTFTYQHLLCRPCRNQHCNSQTYRTCRLLRLFNIRLAIPSRLSYASSPTLLSSFQS
ncbi:hypothetical protein FIBSPDRAFT_219929 [Athelia psychrophila]|uniref:Uncharacterized protein n=1 Tax=Athelia psychrophila TaxID=1759441 RepID=A0A165Z6K0_9AGAM|nr:hypothetical protein FIBSPDRAFT_219929 [Fibularhizoctonia sp. CBS 109695]